MKTLYYSLMVTSIVLLVACGQTTDKTADPPPVEVSTPNTKDTISEYKFKKWTKAWEKDQWEWMKDDTIYSFSMPVVDLSEVVDENAQGTRFYLGLEKIKGKKSEIKLILVGTDGNGDDLVDYENGQYYYDWSTPCPPRCQ